MKPNKLALGLAGAAAAGALAIGGATLANAETSPTPSSSATAGGTDGSATATAPEGQAPADGGTGQTGRGGPGGGSQDTPVTGDKLAEVEAAVKDEDPSITIEEVRMDPDGSYDVLGTSGGEKVFYDVSADLTKIDLAEGPAGGGGQPPAGGSSGSTAAASSDGTAANG